MKVYPQSVYDRFLHKGIWFGIDLEEDSGSKAKQNAIKYATEGNKENYYNHFEYFGNEMEIKFIWDMNADEFKHLCNPIPTEDGTDEVVYDGALFFGNFKLEFMKNDNAGVYFNLFQYGAEDDGNRAYAYLEDGTPYEERYPISDEIKLPYRRTFKSFAENIERQVIDLLNRHTEFIEDALKPTIPSNWYPGKSLKYIKDFTREN